MSDDEQEVRQVVEDYLQNSKPIHWVNWMSRCSDSDAKNLLKDIMFENDHLRDLTDWHIREKVLEAISASSDIMALVIADLVNEAESHTGRDQ